MLLGIFFRGLPSSTGEKMANLKTAITAARLGLDASKETEKLIRNVDSSIQKTAQAHGAQMAKVLARGETDHHDASVEDWKRMDAKRKADQAAKEKFVKENGVKAWDELESIKNKRKKDHDTVANSVKNDVFNMRMVLFFSVFSGIGLTVILGFIHDPIIQMAAMAVSIAAIWGLFMGLKKG